MKINGIKDIFSFFTLIPVNGDIFKASTSIYFLPIISLIVGIVSGLIKYYLAIFTNNFLASAVAVFSMYMITGIMHIDGFADFIDSLFAKGGKEQRIKVLKDPHVGVASVLSVYFLLTLMIILTYTLDNHDLMGSILFFAASDLTGRASVIGSLFGKNYHEGMGKIFATSFKPRYAIYFLLISLILLPFIKYFYLLIFVGLLIGYLFYKTGVRLYGASGGDVIGTSVEISRLIGMIIVCFV